MNRSVSAGRTLALLALCVCAATAWAQGAGYGSSVTLEQAKKIVAGATAEARKNNWPVAIAVVDTHGFLIAFDRLDDTQSGSVKIAIDKAQTAAMFRRPSRAFEDAVTKGRVAVLGLSGVTPISGGLPIVDVGKVVGAIGVSGVTSDQDEQVAKAGLGAM